MTIKTNLKRFALSLAASLLIAGAAHAEADTNATKAPIRLATTTSTEQSGLLGWLLPQFTKETGYPVQVMAAGTGQSLKMGENGDADLVMTHAPSAEKKFVDAGFGIEPVHLMYNDFVIVGPAKIRRVWPSCTMQPRGCRPSRSRARPLSPAVTSPVPTSRRRPCGKPLTSNPSFPVTNPSARGWARP